MNLINTQYTIKHKSKEHYINTTSYSGGLPLVTSITDHVSYAKTWSTEKEAKKFANYLSLLYDGQGNDMRDNVVVKLETFLVESNLDTDEIEIV